MIIIPCSVISTPLPLARQQNEEDANPHGQRGAVSLVGAAACVTQGFQACAKLWLFAPQQQAPDCAVAPAGVQAVRQGTH